MEKSCALNKVLESISSAPDDWKRQNVGKGAQETGPTSQGWDAKLAPTGPIRKQTKFRKRSPRELLAVPAG